VTAGNEYLAQRARDAGARRVEIIPTVIDLERYTPKTDYDTQVPTIVWIGSPSTVRYLSTIAQPLAELATRRKFRLRIIGGQIALPGVDVEYVPWTESGEVASIAACDIGIMPLDDSPWERGKCGYKLIQYMACGLSVVASPIGVNTKIVQEERNGYLANDAASWIERLDALLANPALREGMGRAGRRLVEERYCIQVVAPQLAEYLKQ
jgi:glycosyltransferase involved in cell wall biosynthesis